MDTVLSLGVYDGALRSAVLRMKRPWGEALAMSISHALFDAVGERLVEWASDVVAPIPMHWTRRLVRGTNGPEIVAEVLGRRLGVPVARRLLVRRRKTRRQFSLPPGERFGNVRRAFRVAAGYHLKGVRVLLVDDILTTGATCSEAAMSLRAAGADSVAVVVVARAEGLS
jgi:predicted amidophosphoribosyltransferase